MPGAPRLTRTSGDLWPSEPSGAPARPSRMRPRPLALALIAPLLIAACSVTPSASPTPVPTGSPAPTIGPISTPAERDLSLAELKYRLLDAFSPLSYCDPDEYPVPRGDEAQKAIERFPEIRADEDTFFAILDRLGLAGATEFADADKLAVYRQWKQLNAIALTVVADDRLAFDLLTETDPGLGQGIRSTGTIDTRGTIVVESSEPAFLVSCPICLARGTLIDTPRGPVPVEEFRVGDAVWTADADGRRVEGRVEMVGRARVPAAHPVVHLILDDGRELWASPGHPLADGRRLADVRAGDLVDGARVASVESVAYGEAFTYDLLPSGPTGLYWANGILLGSTLDR